MRDEAYWLAGGSLLIMDIGFHQDCKIVAIPISGYTTKGVSSLRQQDGGHGSRSLNVNSSGVAFSADLDGSSKYSKEFTLKAEVGKGSITMEFIYGVTDRNPGHQLAVEEELSFLVNIVLGSSESGQLETRIHRTMEEHSPLDWVSHPLNGP
ncbi:hypothetical protein ACTFIW_012133 [Dictyostelium discoideum]